ncbi:unnamed protein product, partial [Phaeothamnion confervicola]
RRKFSFPPPLFSLHAREGLRFASFSCIFTSFSSKLLTFIFTSFSVFSLPRAFSAARRCRRRPATHPAKCSEPRRRRISRRSSSRLGCPAHSSFDGRSDSDSRELQNWTKARDGAI